MTPDNIKTVLRRIHETGLNSPREVFVILILGERGDIRAPELAPLLPFNMDNHQVRGLCAILRKKGLIESRCEDFKSYHSLTEHGLSIYHLLVPPTTTP